MSPLQIRKTIVFTAQKFTIMKTKLTSLLVVLFISTISCTAQRTITVEAQNSDISNNLDLQAVASTFGESKDLEDFERRLNDYDSQISNLDLNNDGEVDYLRVIENMENNVHVVVVQAVLDRDVFQDVATIVVEKRDNRRTMVQVIGDPYIYGNDYIIEPVYVYTPSIFSFFWGYNYHSWYSPYYYGYYPRYYHNRHPYEMNFYLSHINSRINHDHRYFYSNNHRNEYAERLHSSMSRNDYGTRYPDRNFSRRNSNVTSKKDFDNARGNNTVYDRSNRASRTTDNNAGSRNIESWNSGANRTQDDVYQNRSTRTYNSVNRDNGSRTERNTQTYTPATRTTTPVTRNTEVNRNNDNGQYQQRQTQTRSTETRQQPTVTRDNNNSRPAPVVNQPSRPTPAVSQPSRPAPVVSQPARSAETPRSNNTKTERGSSSSDNNSRR
jgi:hypothetical protein